MDRVPVQVSKNQVHLELKPIDLSGLTPEQRKAAVEKAKAACKKLNDDAMKAIWGTAAQYPKGLLRDFAQHERNVNNPPYTRPDATQEATDI